MLITKSPLIASNEDERVAYLGETHRVKVIDYLQNINSVL